MVSNRSCIMCLCRQNNLVNKTISTHGSVFVLWPSIIIVFCQHLCLLIGIEFGWCCVSMPGSSSLVIYLLAGVHQFILAHSFLGFLKTLKLAKSRLLWLPPWQPLVSACHQPQEQETETSMHTELLHQFTILLTIWFTSIFLKTHKYSSIASGVRELT